MISPWKSAAYCGFAILSRGEVKVRKHHVCVDCGRSIERNEYATVTRIFDGFTIRADYSCCQRPWH